jgi:hypothetical protein
VNMSKHNEIMASVEIQFAPVRIALQKEHLQKLREARFKARQTHTLKLRAISLMPKQWL